MMKAEGHRNGVIVTHKLRRFFTRLATTLFGEKSDAKIAEEKNPTARGSDPGLRANALPSVFTSGGRRLGERTRFSTSEKQPATLSRR